MTCLEAQSNIMAFIDKKLADEAASDFVRHMRYCKNCREELEIYYTLLVGMRQLDTGEELSHDFKRDLESDLNRVDHKMKQKKRFRVSAFGIVFAVCCVLLLLFYDQTLHRVYNSEQRMKKAAQGETYFYDYYNGCIGLASEDIIDESKRASYVEEMTNYQYIHLYNVLHPKRIMRPEKKNAEEDAESGGETL